MVLQGVCKDSTSTLDLRPRMEANGPHHVFQGVSYGSLGVPSMGPYLL